MPEFYYLDSKNPYLHLFLYMASRKRRDWTDEEAATIFLVEFDRLSVSNLSKGIGAASFRIRKKGVPLLYKQFIQKMLEHNLLIQ